MIARKILSMDFPTLTLKDSCEKAIDLMTEYNVGHLPVVEDGKYLGLINEEQALEQFDIPLGQLHHIYSKARVGEQTHLFEIIGAMSNFNVTLMPVTDQQGIYLGAISLQQLFRAFAEANSLDEPGGIIVLEVHNRDYSLGEIARIVESNDAKIICNYATDIPQENKIEVTLKINRSNLADIIATFERYEYKVKSTFQETSYTQGLKDRYDALMKYLNI